VQAVTDWVIWLMDTFGGVGAGLAIALENVFPPIPSELILPLAGFAASQGSIGLAEALMWTTAGSVVGALALYGLGAGLGLRRMRAVAARLPLVTVEDLDKTQAWFERHGGKAVFFGRMVPLFRSFVSIPAGVHRMPLRKFTLLTFAGSGVWNTLFVLAGYLLGENWHIIDRYAELFQTVVLVAVAAALAQFVVRRGRASRRAPG